MDVYLHNAIFISQKDYTWGVFIEMEYINVHEESRNVPNVQAFFLGPVVKDKLQCCMTLKSCLILYSPAANNSESKVEQN